MTDTDRAASKEKFKIWLLSAAFRAMAKALTLAVEEAVLFLEVATWEFGKLFFCQAEDGIRDTSVTGVQTCALPISLRLLAAALAGCDGKGRALLIERL